MSTTSFSNANFANGDGNLNSEIEGFTPLTPDQMERMRAGFDTDDDPDESFEEPPQEEPDNEPVEGELLGDDVGG